MNDHRFSPSELVELLKKERLGGRLAGICPFFIFLPSKMEVQILEDEEVYQEIHDAGMHYADGPAIIGLSGRLLVVARNPS